ncbi:Fungal-trans domain-containing protein [Fusarium keratoplasticum]|nr:Fungal-trans domain-containing protein [Fusarium keratoplasticum]
MAVQTPAPTVSLHDDASPADNDDPSSTERLPRSGLNTNDPASSGDLGADETSALTGNDHESAMTAFEHNNDLFNSLPWLINDLPSHNSLFWVTDYPDPLYPDLGYLPSTDLEPSRGPFLAQESTSFAYPDVSLQDLHASRTEGTGDSIRMQSSQRNQWPGQDSSAQLPVLTSEDQNVIHAQLFGYLRQTAQNAFQKVADFYTEQNQYLGPFMDKVTFQTFLELYFEHFADHFPFLHPTLLEDDDISWVLLLAVAVVGAQFSALKNAPLFANILQDLLDKAVKMHCPEIPSSTDLTWAQIILLRDICMLFNGGKKHQVARQYEKNKLITLSRVLKTDNPQLSLSTEQTLEQRLAEQDWKRWIAAESRIRVLHSVYFLECLQFVFHDIRPSVELTDLTNTLPCEESVWKCHSEEEWRQALVECRHQPSSPGNDSLLDWKNAPKADGYVQKLLFVYIYTEERLTMERLRNSPFRQVLFPSISTALFQQQWTGLGRVDPRGLLKIMRSSVASELDLLQPVQESGLPSKPVSGDQDVLHILIHLLRDVPMRSILAFAGWQVDDGQVEAAKLELTGWAFQHERVARQCLLHAITVFNILRTKSTFAAYDALSLLTATLYIWMYDQLIEEEDFESQHTSSRLIIRSDRVSDRPALERWVNNGGVARIHIPGVGIFGGRGGRSRLLHELRRILLSRTEWSRVCQVIAKAVMHLLQEKRPRFEEDVRSGSITCASEA